MPPTTWPAPVQVPPFRAAAVSGRGPDELGRYYWRVTRGGARGDDVSERLLRGGRWLAPEYVARALREAAEKEKGQQRRTIRALLAKFEKHVQETAESPATVENVEGAVRRLVSDQALADLELVDVSRETLAAARGRLLQTYASGTVQRDLKHLASAWRWAQSAGVSLQSWPGVRVTVYDTRPKPVPSESEVEAIRAHLAALDDWRLPAYLVLVETGARRSEVMSLRLADVDLAAGLVRVRGKLTAQAGPGATRTIPLPLDGDALPALRRWCAARVPGPLWPSSHGRTLDGAVRAAAKAAGVRPMAPGAWRRRADGLLIGAGKLAELEAIMDHSLEQALATYNRPDGQAVQDAVSMLKRRA